MKLLGLGSNVGDRWVHLRRALYYLRQLPNLVVKNSSPVYESKALLQAGAPKHWDQPYLNLVVQIETSLAPEQLFPLLQEIERQIGRKKQSMIWAPRCIDIDLLYWDHDILKTLNVTIPHRGLF